MARLLIVTPAPRGSRKGNRVTANRWAHLLRNCGHQVAICEEFIDQKCDVMIAFHARKSAASVERCVDDSPGTPIVLLLTGTDLYQDIHRNQRAANALEQASLLVLLQGDGISQLPHHLHSRVRVVIQSATGFVKAPQPLKRHFEICVSGHLRPVKDPFRAAMAARQLPSESRIRITHIGAALTPAMKRRALDEMDRNSRYRWLGNVSGARAKRLLARSRLLVLPSKKEGGANVISEAIATSVPVLASKISGSLGLLGSDYPGYFDVGDTKQLTALMSRCERDEEFYNTLKASIAAIAPQFTPQREQESLKRLIDDSLDDASP